LTNKLPEINNTKEFVLSKILEYNKIPENQVNFIKEFDQLKSVVAEFEKFIQKEN